MITDWLDPVSYKLGQAAGGGGGGNPNYVETISGTVANPWGTYSPSALFTAAESGAVSISITATVEGVPQSPMIFVGDIGRSERAFVYPKIQSSGAVDNSLSNVLVYGSTGSVLHYGTFTNPSEGMEYINDDTTVLTIVHHPLP